MTLERSVVLWEASIWGQFSEPKPNNSNDNDDDNDDDDDELSNYQTEETLETSAYSWGLTDQERL